MSPKLVSREDVVGKPVIDQKGSIIGNAKDIAFSVGTEEVKIALVVESDAGELTIDWGSIKAVNDVVLLNRSLRLSLPQSQHILYVRNAAIRISPTRIMAQDAALPSKRRSDG